MGLESLSFDLLLERFTDSAEANSLLAKRYRSPTPSLNV